MLRLDADAQLSALSRCPSVFPHVPPTKKARSKTVLKLKIRNSIHSQRSRTHRCSQKRQHGVICAIVLHRYNKASMVFSSDYVVRQLSVAGVLLALHGRSQGFVNALQCFASNFHGFGCDFGTVGGADVDEKSNLSLHALAPYLNRNHRTS